MSPADPSVLSLAARRSASLRARPAKAKGARPAAAGQSKSWVQTLARERATDQQLRQRVYALTVLQQPEKARLSSFKDSSDTSDRRPVDPPIILQVHLTDLTRGGEHAAEFLESVSFFARAHLVAVDPLPQDAVRPEDIPQEVMYAGGEWWMRVKGPKGGEPIAGEELVGGEKMPDPSGRMGVFFIFSKLSIRLPGKYRLLFSLYEITGPVVRKRAAVVSDVFEVFSPKLFTGMTASTPLTKHVARQGVKVKIRGTGLLTASAARLQANPDAAAAAAAPLGPPPAAVADSAFAPVQGPGAAGSSRTRKAEDDLRGANDVVRRQGAGANGGGSGGSWIVPPVNTGGGKGGTVGYSQALQQQQYYQGLQQRPYEPASNSQQQQQPTPSIAPPSQVGSYAPAGLSPPQPPAWAGSPPPHAPSPSQTPVYYADPRSASVPQYAYSSAGSGSQSFQTSPYEQPYSAPAGGSWNGGGYPHAYDMAHQSINPSLQSPSMSTARPRPPSAGAGWQSVSPSSVGGDEPRSTTPLALASPRLAAADPLHVASPHWQSAYSLQLPSPHTSAVSIGTAPPASAYTLSPLMPTNTYQDVHLPTLYAASPSPHRPGGPHTTAGGERSTHDPFGFTYRPGIFRDSGDPWERVLHPTFAHDPAFLGSYPPEFLGGGGQQHLRPEEMATGYSRQRLPAPGLPPLLSQQHHHHQQPSLASLHPLHTSSSTPSASHSHPHPHSHPSQQQPFAFQPHPAQALSSSHLSATIDPALTTVNSPRLARVGSTGGGGRGGGGDSTPRSRTVSGPGHAHHAGDGGARRT